MNEQFDAEGDEMSTHRYRRVTRTIAEQMLSDVADGSSTSPDALTDLLITLAPTVARGELPGEHAALAAYRAARIIPSTGIRTRSMRNTVMAKFVTVKAVAILVLAAASGVAVAAGAGVMPERTSGHHAVHGQQSNPGHVNAGHSHSPGTTTTHPSPSTSPTAGQPGSSASSSSSLRGLCRAYPKISAGHQGKALDAAAFAALTVAAGGEDQVSGFCATLLAATRPGSPATTHAGVTGQGYQPSPHGSGHPKGSPDPHWRR